MTRRSFQLFLGAAVLPQQNLLAQDGKVILARVSEVYQSLRSYFFEGKFIAESTIRGKSSRTELGFVVAFEAPNKFHLEFRYPRAGNWLRVSDGEFLLETRSVPKESERKPVTEWTIRALNSSPIYNFERLSTTAENPTFMNVEPVTVDGKQIDCQRIQFSSHRRKFREGESPGPSIVWVAKDTAIVLREEIRSSASVRGEVSESMRTTMIEKFRVNESLSGDLFSTKEDRG